MRRVHALLWFDHGAWLRCRSPRRPIAQDQPVRPTRTRPRSKTRAQPAQNADAPRCRSSDDECDRRHRPAPRAAVGAQHQAQQRPDRRRDRRRRHRQAARHHRLGHRGAHPGRPGRARTAAKRAACSSAASTSTYYTTTYNGREIFTAETRSVALQDFPSGAIAALEAFKTSTANLVEPGIAGLVNVRSRRPFDFKGFEVAGSVWGCIRNQSRDVDAQRQPPDQRPLAGRRRRNRRPDQFLLHPAALSGFDPPPRLLHRRPRRAAGRRTGRKSITTRATAGGRRSTARSSGARHRDLELYAEGLWQGYRERRQRRHLGAAAVGRQPATTISSSATTPTRSSAAPSTSPRRAAAASDQGFQGATKRETNTYQFAVGGSYDAGPLRDHRRPRAHQQHLQAAHRERRLRAQHATIIRSTGSPAPGRVTARPSRSSASIPPTRRIYNYRGFFEDYADRQGQGLAGRGSTSNIRPAARLHPEDPVGRPLRRSRRVRRPASVYWNRQRQLRRYQRHHRGSARL